MSGSSTRNHLLALFASCCLLPLASAQADTSKLPLVVVSQAQQGDFIQQVPLTGSLTSSRSSRLSPQVSGRIEHIVVEEGDRLEADALLLHLDSELAEHSLEAARAATQQAEAELTDARRRYENGQELRQSNSISSNELDLLEAEVQIKRAALARQQAEQRRQQAIVTRHNVVAPYAGVISERLVDVGEWVEPGEAMFNLVSLDALRAEFRVPQEYFMQVDADSEVTLVFDALPEREFNGQIQAIIPVSDPSARTFLIHVTFDKADARLTPGMSVRARLNLDAGRQAVIISRDALLRYPDGRTTVWTVSRPDGGATVSEQLIEIGPGFNGKVPVLSGLQPGSYVVVQGNESLTSDQRVRIQAAP